MSRIYDCRWPVILLLFAVCASCAGSGAGTKTRDRQAYNASLGISYRAEFFGVSQHILINKYQYQFIREEENPRLIYFQTAWKNRSVFADEVDMGIVAAQSRIRITAKARHAGQYSLDFYAENNVRYEGKDEWEPGPLSPMCEKFFDQVAEDLRFEFRLLY